MAPRRIPGGQGFANVKRCTLIVLVIFKIMALPTHHGLGKKIWCLCEENRFAFPSVVCALRGEGWWREKGV